MARKWVLTHKRTRWRLLLEQSYILPLIYIHIYTDMCACRCVYVWLKYAHAFMSFRDPRSRARECVCLKRQLSHHKSSQPLGPTQLHRATSHKQTHTYTHTWTCVPCGKCNGKVVFVLQRDTLHATVNIFAHLKAAGEKVSQKSQVFHVAAERFTVFQRSLATQLCQRPALPPLPVAQELSVAPNHLRKLVVASL